MRGKIKHIGKWLAVVVVLALLGALALVVGDSTYHASPVGWIPFVAALACLVFARVYAGSVARHVELGQAADVTDCMRGSDVVFGVSVVNRGLLPVFALRLTFHITDLFGETVHRAETTVALSPRERLELPISMTFEHVGTYAAGLESAEAVCFLGLFSRSISGATPVNVCVTPRVQEISSMEYVQDVESENMKPARSVISDSMDYAAVREYEPGDPLKTVHWKLSVRGTGLMTRLYESYTDSTVSVLADFYASGGTPDDLMQMYDVVVESALSTALYAREQGMDPELHYVDKYGEHVKTVAYDSGHIVELMRSLPRMSSEPADAAPFLDVLRSQVESRTGANNLIVCSANVGPELVGLLVSARMQKRTPFLISAVPRSLVDRDLERHVAALNQLSDAGIGFVVISSSEDLSGVSL